MCFFKELRVTRTSSRISRGTTAEEGDFITQHSPRHLHSMQAPQSGLHRQQQESGLLQPLVMQFSIMLQVFKCVLLSQNFIFSLLQQEVQWQFHMFSLLAMSSCLQSVLLLEEPSSMSLSMCHQNIFSQRVLKYLHLEKITFV